MAETPQSRMEPATAQPDLPALADRVASLLLTQGLGADLDLREVEGSSELTAHLSRVFEAPYAPLLQALAPAAGDDGAEPALAPVLRMLVGQIAAARADLFLVKTAMMTQNRYLAGHVSSYRDPLAAARALMDETAENPPAYRAVEVFLPFDAQIMGSGWHAPETDAEGRAFRWSNRARDISVVLPVFGPGLHEISMDYQVLVPDQMNEFSLKLDGLEVEAEQEQTSEKGGILRFAHEVEPGRSTAFQLLDISIAGPVRPSDYGLNDKRVIGLKTRGFTIAYAGYGG
ncbi:hypothetical protein [Salipiger sp.]|uniref:hypothetical protein n=1 Tax=Salipiger sp. TaxID=2078585 RepID=UPI003A97A34E